MGATIDGEKKFAEGTSFETDVKDFYTGIPVGCTVSLEDKNAWLADRDPYILSCGAVISTSY